MKPCAKNRKRLVWLALDAVNAGQARELRAHLETCDGCRSYLKEISKISETLNASVTRTGLEASESFHRKVISRLRAEKSEPAWATTIVRLRAILSDWRVAIPVSGVAAVVVTALFMVLLRPVGPGSDQPNFQVPSAAVERNDLPPTIANYQTVANRSLDEFDELLTRQGNKVCPPVPLYTASTLTRMSVLD